MSAIVTPGNGIVFMKVGTHAQETLEDIFERKTKEIERTGYAMWGYGGNTCHPRTMVQPFALEHASAGRPIYLCMEEMNSKHWAPPTVAAEFSPDGLDWSAIPTPIEVRGSRFALTIKALRKERFTLPLDQTKVALGMNMGRSGSRYINGRVDKACLDIMETAELSNDTETRELPISLVAELSSPFAVFLRGNR